MYILGVSAFTHDTSAALIKDGKLICFVEEERLNRKKHTTDFPYLAIEECLKLGNISPSQIDLIAISQVPYKEIVDNVIHVLKYFPKSLNLLFEDSSKTERNSFFKKLQTQFFLERDLKNKLEWKSLPKVGYFSHHLCHNASSFYASGFEESALLSLDGRGESCTTMMGFASLNTGVNVVSEVSVPHSLGHLFAAITDYLGFKAFHDEWKVMGLSAYGTGAYLKDFEKLVKLDSIKGFELDLSYFEFHQKGQRQWLSEKFYEKFGPPRSKQEDYNQRHKDLAFALQRVVENVGVHLANLLYKKVPSDNLCLSGGVALNCLMNSAIIEKSKFKNVFVQPIANDAGASIGAAWLALERQGFLKKCIFNKLNEFSVYLGRAFSDKEIQETLDKNKVDYKLSKNIEKETAALLAQNMVVGWFQGAMEAGPRALGNRSVLANPNKSEMKDRINKLIKKREYFRPFAPSVLVEKASEFFDLPNRHLSPYMVLTASVKKEKQSVIPAVTHFDGTARVQTVSLEMNEKYYNLLKEFYSLTNIPVLLNTSFNENEPIVHNPQEALDCYLRTDLDALVMGNFILLKNSR